MITVPTLLLDEKKCRQNIRKMSQMAESNRVVFRPHFKTHVSAEIGEWFREEGVNKITVSSLRMASYFADAGWKDILVAFPVNILEMDTINDLAKRIDLSLLVESAEIVKALSSGLKTEVSVYLKVDIGLGRTGIRYDDFETFSFLLDRVSKQPGMSLKGFLTHAGHSYRARSYDEIQKVHIESISRMHALKDHFSKDYPGILISVGDTPTCSTMQDFSMVDEIRPGNFVFYDLTQVIIGSCNAGQVAVAMACPVVAVHKDRSEVVIYGGSVHFAKDSVTDREGKTIYGAVVKDEGNGWGEIIEGAWLKKLSQEHGVVHLPYCLSVHYKPGDIIKIIPAHSCTTANLMREYLTLDGRIISRQ